MIFVPVINDIAFTHLTQADWDVLGFSHVAIDVINLFIHPHCIIPNNIKTVFLDSQICSCHKISGKSSKKNKGSGDFFLHSPHDGRKIAVTSENIQEIMKPWKDERTIVIDEMNRPSGYIISEKPGSDAVKGLLHRAAQEETIDIKDKKWAEAFEPIDPTCNCYTCKNFTLSYLHHLHNVKVPLGVRLGIIHNLSCKL